ncbi:MAG: zeta toxin family protein, partial [Rhodanobacteraceae bacterium]
SHLTLPGVSLKFTLHPHVKRAIWRQVQTGDTYLAHAVGAGKTIEMIAGGMEQKRLGLIKKPMYVVPNHMLEQFSNEFMDLYPLANIMVADDHAFSKDRRKAFVAAATLNAPDAVIITHSAFERIGVREASVAPIRDRMLDELQAQLDETGSDQRVRRAQLQQQIEAVNQRFDRIIGAGSKDSTINFEDIGADFLYVDEAHAFRKLDFNTAQQVKGIDPNGSKRALDMFVKTQYLESQRPGRAMVFASGTPVTNTMGELYTILRFFNQHELDRTGTATFDSWARMYGEAKAELEANAAGRYENVTRFSKFDNVPELMSRIRQFMDVLTSQHLGALVKRPDLEGGKPNLVLVPPTKGLKRYMKEVLLPRLDASRAWKPSKDEPFNPDPVLAIISDGRFAALDPRFFGDAVEPGTPTKITAMADAIAAEYHATAGNKYTGADGKDAERAGSTQVVFYNMGFGAGAGKRRGFDARAELQRLLLDKGVKRNEIAWFDDANSDAKKEAIFKKMRSGELRVLIGSAKKMGTGVNVQNRLSMLHYFDPPWYPSDVEQPHGRIIRQGNQNDTVRINWYATEGTYDSTMWQMVGRKQRFIDQAFSGDKSLRTMEDVSEASMYEQAAAIASGDPRALQLAGLRQDVERYERLQAAHHNEQVNIASALNRAEWDEEQRSKRVAIFEDALQAIGGEYVSSIEAKLGDATYTKAGEFGQAVKDAFNAAAEAYDEHPSRNGREIGTLNGFPIRVTPETEYGRKESKLTGRYDLDMIIKGLTLHIATDRRAGESTDATGLGRRFVNALNRISTDLDDAKRKLQETKDDLKVLRKKRGAPFAYARELAEKYRDLKQLEEELRAEGANDNAGGPDIPPELQRFEGEEPVPLDAENFGMNPPRPLRSYDLRLRPRDRDNSRAQQLVRRRLIDERFAGHHPVPAGVRPTALVMGGGGASGKSAVLGWLEKHGELPHDAVHLDPDDFKTGSVKRGTHGLPQYEEVQRAGDSRAAEVTHEESAAMYRRAMRRAIAGRYNVILDRTMNNGAKAREEMRELRRLGYYIVHVGVSVPVHEALARAERRAREEPEARFVPPDQLIKAHRGYSAEGLDAVNAVADAMRLFSNFVARGDTPIEIARGGSGKVEILDAKRYNQFREKANVNQKATRYRDLYEATAEASPDQRGVDRTDEAPGSSERNAGGVEGGARGGGPGGEGEQPAAAAAGEAARQEVGAGGAPPPETTDLGGSAESRATYGTPHRIQRSRGAVAEDQGDTSGAGGNVRSAAAVPGSLDLFAPEGNRGAVQTAAPRLLQSVKVVRTGTYRSGITRVRTWQDAAHIIAPLRKSPQEQALAVVADAEGKPLAVLRHSIGTIDSSSVVPGTVFGAIAQIPGAKQVWFAHNHPSGYHQQSGADRNITGQLQDLMRGSGITARGMIVVAPGERRATCYDTAIPVADRTAAGADGVGSGSPITAAARRYDVPLVERALRKIPRGDRQRAAIVSPRQAPDVAEEVAGGENGVVLLDNRHRVLGFLPMTDAEMGRLRTEDPATGAARVAKVVTEANAAAAMTIASDVRAGANVNRMLDDAGVRPLDLLQRKPGGRLVSAAGQGLPHVARGPFYSARTGTDTLADRPRGSARNEADQGSGVPEGLPTRATAAALTLERKFNGWLRSQGETRPAVFREIRRDALPDAMGRALAATENALGVKIHVVKNLTPEIERWNGLTFRDGHLYVDATAQAPVTTVAAHEFTHQLRASAPDLYARLEAEVRRQGRLPEWLAERQRRAGREKVDTDLSVEELTADAVGDAMADPAFLDRMAKRNPGAFRELAQRFIDFINRILGRAKDLGSNKYLTDVARFRDELADVLDRYARGERGEAGKDGVAFDREAEPREPGPTFYSALTRSIEQARGTPKSGTPEQWKQWLDGAQRRGEFKQAEREWAGIDQFLVEHKGKISREDMARFAMENRVQVREVMHRDEIPQDEATNIVDHQDGGFHVTDADGAVAGSAKFGEYALPGGGNYRELLLTLPPREGTPAFDSGHYHEPNIVAHLRMDDRVGPNGEKILHVEEVQSDWHQAGRKRGYATPER